MSFRATAKIDRSVDPPVVLISYDRLDRSVLEKDAKKTSIQKSTPSLRKIRDREAFRPTFDDGRFRLHWDSYWGGYRVSKPEIDDIEVVPAEVYDDLVDAVRALVSDVEAFIEAVGDLL